MKFKSIKLEIEQKFYLYQYIRDFKHHAFIKLLINTKLLQMRLDLFVNEVSLGASVIIPQEFRISNLPQSFRFYDPILVILQ